MPEKRHQKRDQKRGRKRDQRRQSALHVYICFITHFETVTESVAKSVTNNVTRPVESVTRRAADGNKGRYFQTRRILFAATIALVTQDEEDTMTLLLSPDITVQDSSMRMKTTCFSFKSCVHSDVRLN